MTIFNNQFNSEPLSPQKRQAQTVSVVVAKPTRVCNADCQYCSSPPLEELGASNEPMWTFEKFKLYFDKVYPTLMHGANWIWHGGEPMLMGPQFYIDCYEYAQERAKEEGREVYFSMQSNLLGYSTKKWYKVFSEVFRGAISTSFDPDEAQRTIKGNAQSYSRVFKRALSNVLEDGFRPMVIGVYSEETAPLMVKMYEWSKSLGDKAFAVRFNYCHPTGRIEHGGEAISAHTYADALLDIYNRWLVETPPFTITPLDQMFKKTIGMDGEGHCPWTRKCGGRFLEIEPNGDLYNCSEFADLGGKYCFGNLEDSNKTIHEMLQSRPALQIRRRAVQVPQSCSDCEHFQECEGGCMRDAALYQHGLYGKFHYCVSWKKVFTRIKSSILSGEADKILERYSIDSTQAKSFVSQNIQAYFDFSPQELKSVATSSSVSPLGFGDNYMGLSKSNYDQQGQYIPLMNGAQPYSYKSAFKDPEVSPYDGINNKLKQISLVVIKG